MPGTSLIEGDCLKMMRGIGDDSVNMVFADLPYGVTQNRWDVVIPFEPLWEQLLRVGKKNCAFVFTATQPFATALICSQPKLFRYDLVWKKNRPSNYLNASKQPMRNHESVLLFGGKTYNAQMVPGKKYKVTTKVCKSQNWGTNMPRKESATSGAMRYSRTVLELNENDLRHDRLNGHVPKLYHPTQKPVALMEWLIKSYSNEGDLILDPVMGSGTTGVACMNTGRHFIGIEKDPTYFEVACKRIETTPRPVV